MNLSAEAKPRRSDISVALTTETTNTISMTDTTD